MPSYYGYVDFYANGNWYSKTISTTEDEQYPYYIKEDSMTFARFVVMPKEFKGFYLEFNSPIFYALQSTDVNETPNSIKLLFKASSIAFSILRPNITIFLPYCLHVSTSLSLISYIELIIP